MAQLTHAQYDLIERAVALGTRLAVQRSNGRESVLIPLALRVRDGRELIQARNPTTGHELTLYLDEITSVESLA
jgi:hypothetical protein